MFVEHLRRGEALDAKVAVLGAQLAPRADQRDVDIIGHGDRPDGAVGMSAVHVGIGDVELAAVADGAAQLGHVDAFGRHGIALGDEDVLRAERRTQRIGSTTVTLAKTLSAASCSLGSRTRRTMRAPTAIASTSSMVNISGGRSKPLRST